MKLSAVYSSFVKTFPWLAKIISFDLFADLVDEALENLSEILQGDVTKENIDFLKECDIVIEAFDDPKNKATLCNTVLRNFKDKYLIASSGMAG